MIKLPASTRYKVLFRDGNSCVNCKKSAEEGTELKILHITPLAAGGTNNIHNLLTVCGECAIEFPHSAKKIYSPLNAHSAIPSNYALGIIKQALKSYRTANESSEFSFEEAFIAANNPNYIQGINPLYTPLPKNAVISALLVLQDDGKISIEGKLIKLQTFR